MKILFVSSGKLGEVSYLVKNQGISIEKEGVDIDYFIIQGGWRGYLRSIRNIRRKFEEGNYSLIHAHYSFSAFVATLAGRFPMVVSLMGSDAYASHFYRSVAKFFYRHRWNATIVKSQEMKEVLGMDRALVIPNGVDTERYREIPKLEAREKIKYTKPGKLVVFVANPERHEKNFGLAQQAVEALGDKEVELMAVYNTPNELVPYYMNAADALILSSKWEGSPNVIKEAMACNLPIVSTHVGDVRENTQGVKGCFVCDRTAEALADGLKRALQMEKSEGRDRIFELQLDSQTVANRIVSIYKEVIQQE